MTLWWAWRVLQSPASRMFTQPFIHSGADQRKYQSSASLAFVRGIHRWPVNSPHKEYSCNTCIDIIFLGWFTAMIDPVPIIWDDMGSTDQYHTHDDVIKWKHFPRYWPFARGIHRSPVNSPYKGQWRGALLFSLIYASINRWENNREAGDLRRYRAHYDLNVMNKTPHNKVRTLYIIPRCPCW